MRQTLFISYSWANSIIADKIDTAFQPTGLYVKRDIREIAYKGSIKDYMKEVRETDFVLIIISDNFIKSSNCMYEVLELLKEKNFNDKILPVVLDGTKIFKPEDRIEYIKYWTEKHAELEIKDVNITDALEIYKELKHIEKIRTTIDEFLSYVSGVNVLSFSELSNQNFKPIFNHIGVSDELLINRILSLSKMSSDDEKEIELDKLENEFPNNPKVYVAKAIHAFRQKKIQNSNYFYRRSIQLDPTFAASFYNLGYNIEVFAKGFDEAKSLYEKAIELDPRNIKAINNLAGLYSSEFNIPEKAKELYQMALEINPYDATGHYNLATLISRDFNDYENARYHYEFAIKLKPDFVDAKHNYGMVLWKDYHELAEAKKQFLEIIELEPQKKSTLKQIGRLLEEEYKHFESAKIYYDLFIGVEPNTAEDHYWYATFLMLYFLPKFKTLARMHYEEACVMDNTFRSNQVEILLH